MIDRLSHRLTRSVLFWDIVLTCICLYLASRIRLWVDIGNELEWHQIEWPWQLYLAVGAIWSSVLLLITPHRKVFTGRLIEVIGQLVATVGLASLTFAGLLYLSFRDVSRLQFLYFAVGNLVVLLAFHLTIRTFVRLHRHGPRRRVLFVGAEHAALQLAREFARHPWSGLHVVGFTSPKPVARMPAPVIGPVETTARLVVEHQIDEVIFALPPDQQDQVVRISLQLQQYPVMLHMVPGVLDLAFARTAVDTLAGVPLISLRESVLSEPQRIFKRIFDIVASAVLLVIFAPVMLVIAALIKLESPGPVFFLQERLGEYGRRFKMIKFRSMYVDAEQRWHEVVRRDERGALYHKSADDPRVTPIGRKLRRISLDELPQLFNVLRGEMSLVGPRPEIPHVAAEYQPWQWQRFRIPPGMTGWWQINGRSDRPMHLHTEDDLYYIQNYSFWLDLQILFKTVAVVLSGNGAY